MEEGSFSADASNEESRVTVARIPWLRGRKGGGDCSRMRLGLAASTHSNRCSFYFCQTDVSVMEETNEGARAQTGSLE